MSQKAPLGARCQWHPEVDAEWACGRCGNFFCVDCAQRTRPDALPMCPNCWKLRGKVVTEIKVEGPKSLVSAGLVLGVIALVPMCLAIQIAAVVVNAIALSRTREPEYAALAKRAKVGLALSLCGVAFTVIGFVLVAVMGN